MEGCTKPFFSFLGDIRLQNRGTLFFSFHKLKGKGEETKLIDVSPIDLEGHTFLAVTVLLPKTTLLTVSNDKGYIMCGALDVGLLNDRLKDRKIIAGRAVGVKTIQQLLDAPLESVTHEAEALGIHKGMIGKEALLKMI
jgi:uncharacterized protein YunC (DUF1805 family)